MSNQEAVDKVSETLEALLEPPTEKDICLICEKMAIEAVNKRGSKDNVTVEIALFEGINGYSPAMDAVPDDDEHGLFGYRSTSAAQHAKTEVKEYRFESAHAKEAGAAPWATECKKAPAPTQEEEKKGGVDAPLFDDDDLMEFLNDDSNF